MDGDQKMEQFESIYSKLKESKETNPQTRLYILLHNLKSRWMLYLLLTLKYQTKSVSVSSFSVPKLPVHSPYTVSFLKYKRIDSKKIKT